MSGEEESFVILDCSPSMTSHRASLQDLSHNCLKDTSMNCESFEESIPNLSIFTQNEKSLHLDSLVSSDNDKSLKMESSSGLNKSFNGMDNSTKNTKLEDFNRSLIESRDCKPMEYSVWNTNGLAKNDSLKADQMKAKLDSLKTDEMKTKEDCLETDGHFFNAVNISVHQNNIGTTSSLATSFILGEHNSNDLKKASLFSMFPNLMTNAYPEEVAKLQALICEVSSLRQTCLAAERTTKRYFDFSNAKFEDLTSQIESLQRENREYKLHESSKQTKNDEIQKKLNDLDTKYIQLRDENTKLHQEVKQHNDHLKVTTDLYEKDLHDMRQTISQKDALIRNMRHYMDKLESEQTSWENIPGRSTAPKDKEQQQKLQFEKEEEMLEKFKSLETENQNLKIQQEMFVAQLNGLQVNLTQSEENLKAAKDDIALLQAKDIDKDNIIRTMRSEIEVLKHQAEVYYSDFTMERTSREKLAGDRDKLVLDLRALQHRNKQLTMQLEKNSQQPISEAGNMESISSTEGAVGGVVEEKKPEDETLLDDGQYRCPVCCKCFYNTSLLQTHVNACLDNIK